MPGGEDVPVEAAGDRLRQRDVRRRRARARPRYRRDRLTDRRVRGAHIPLEHARGNRGDLRGRKALLEHLLVRRPVRGRPDAGVVHVEDVVRGLALHVHLDRRLVDETDREGVGDVVLGADLEAEVLHLVVAAQPVGETPELVATGRDLRRGELLELKIGPPQTHAHRPAVEDLIGDVGREDEALNRRLHGAEVEQPAIVIRRAEAVVRLHAEAERESVRQRHRQLEVRQHEHPGVQRILAVRRPPLAHIDPPARMLGDKADRDLDVGEVGERRGVVEVGRSIHRLAHQCTSHRVRNRGGLIKSKSTAEDRRNGQAGQRERQNFAFH